MGVSGSQIKTKKPGRNDPCHCGSGKKYKQCCGRIASTSAGSGQWSVPRAMQVALEYHQAGRLPEAEALYRQILQVEPNHSDALHYLGVIATQGGKHEIAVELIYKAISANSSNPIYYNNLGLALREQGKLDEAIASFLKALSLKPDFADAHNNLGNALLQQGKLDQAVASFCRALSFKPDVAVTHSNLGAALNAQGKLDEAVAHYRKALSLKPGDAVAHYNLGNVLNVQDKLDEAIACFRQALSFKPDFADAHNNLGNALLQQGKLDQAVASFCRALSFKPDVAVTHSNLGNARLQQGRPDEAVASFQKALSLSPDLAVAHNNLGNAFKEQGRLDEAIAGYRHALAIRPDYAEAYSNLLFAIYFCPMESPAKLTAECERFAAQIEAPLRASWQRHANLQAPGRQLKVGYVSPDFRRHAVAFFIEPVLANHDKDRIEIFCYYNHAQHDEFTDRLAGYADRWLDCKRMTDEQLAARIRSDGIDILVDLAGHTAGNRMLTFARKPAPIQITYLGCPGASSGLTAMDYRLTDACADPAGCEVYYTEKLLRLPDSLWCYRPDKNMPEILALPAQQNGYVTLGSFNNFNKIDGSSIELWARLLRAVPRSRLLMVTVPEGASRRQLTERFAALGVPAERLEFHGKLPSDEFFRMFQRVDIALDPFPVTGGATTCETLWMGVPVISPVGTRCMSRMTFSILSAVGLRELAAATPEDYVRIAVNLCQNLPRLAGLRAGLRAQVAGSPLVDGARFTRNLEEIYRDVWTQWCNTST